jgi:hypothetical protein
MSPAAAGTPKEVPVEQQSGASGAAQAQAARTILPGEPFEPPTASQVPAPRAEAASAPAETTAFAPAEAPLAPPAWGAQQYQPMAAPQGAPLYQAAPATYVEPQLAGGDFDTLHDFASLPVAPQFGAVPAVPAEAFSPAAFPPPPAEAPTFAPAPAAFAPAQPVAGFPPPVFAPAVDDSLPPLPPAQDDEGLFAEPEKGKKDRKPVDKRLLAGALVVVLAGGGYFGYTQLSKKSSSDNATGPVAPVTAPVKHYAFPSNVAGLKLQPSNPTLLKGVRAEVAKWSAPLAKTMNLAVFNPGTPAIAATVFHPAPAQLAAKYASLLRFVATPDKGNVEVPSHVAVPGAAGGQMTCGGQSGPDAASWCVWKGTNTIGVFSVDGSPKTQITEILTREMRAFAEH